MHMGMEKLLDQPVTAWMSGKGPESDIVLSSRIRLARNLSSLPFPQRAGERQLQQVEEEMRASLADLNQNSPIPYVFGELDKLTPLERYVLVEKHLVSLDLVRAGAHRAVLVREDAAVSIMINEEDHLRIQCLLPGLQLEEAMALADQVDDTLEARHDYAFDEKLGYLTACPTNLGTGLRASVMLHLPALVMTKQINRLMSTISQLGIAVRGLYGEGSEAIGNIFQVSNQLTLGFSEHDIIANLRGVVLQVIAQERKARQTLLTSAREAITDRVWRAYGVLRYAYCLDSQEALQLLSQVRLGADMHIIDVVPPAIFNELLVTTQPNFLQRAAGGGPLDATERDKLRARSIRQRLAALAAGSEHNTTKVQGG